MRCLVLGGAGFIGRHVVSELAATGHEPIVGDVVPASAGVAACLVDLGRRPTIMRALAGVECVIHLAWATNPASANARPIDDVRQNVIGSLRLFECCVDRRVRRIVFCSTGGAIYGQAQRLPIPEDHPTEPLSSYGVTKLATEVYLRSYGRLHGIEFMILRPGNAYGEGQRVGRKQGVIAACLDAIARGRTLEVWGDGTVVRDYVHVADVARALVLAAAATRHGETLNIGTGQGHSVNDIIEMSQKVAGASLAVNDQPARAFDMHDNVLDPTRASQGLAWRPRIELREGLARQWRALGQSDSEGPLASTT